MTGPERHNRTRAAAIATLALATFAAGCGRGEVDPAPEPSKTSQRNDAIRGMLDRMTPDERRAFVGERLKRAIDFVQRDPLIRGFVDRVLTSTPPRVSFELVADVPRLAERLGMGSFDLDALTATIEVPSREGAPTRFQHIVNLAPECFTNDGRLIVVLLHEFLHMERRERGIPIESVAAEEVAVFTDGIGRAHDIAVALRTPPVGASIVPQQLRVADEIDEALAVDRLHLGRWLRESRSREK